MTTSQRIGVGAFLSASLIAFGFLYGQVNQRAPNTGTTPSRILLIRHAEKPTANLKDIHLSEAGKERANNLHRLFTRSDDRPDPFPTPDFVFATNTSSMSRRPVETVTPLAAELKLTIDKAYHNNVMPAVKDGKEVKGIRDLTEALFGDAKYEGKTVLICWHHGAMPDLARSLRVASPPRWDKDTFDRVWQITYDKNGKATLANLPQRLMPGDSKK